MSACVICQAYLTTVKAALAVVDLTFSLVPRLNYSLTQPFILYVMHFTVCSMWMLMSQGQAMVTT